LLKNFVLNGQVSGSNPLLHIHAKRYVQFENLPLKGEKQMNKMLLPFQKRKKTNKIYKSTIINRYKHD
ncbi:MAG: hypothetical protein ACMXYE_05690, partial [Candidatus Woesearchaeota archaeon]